MTGAELVEWTAFEKSFGPLTVQERVDAAGATAAWGARSAMGSKSAPGDYLPDWKQKRQQTAEEMIAFMGDVQKRLEQQKEQRGNLA